MTFYGFGQKDPFFITFMAFYDCVRTLDNRIGCCSSIFSYIYRSFHVFTTSPRGVVSFLSELL